MLNRHLIGKSQSLFNLMLVHFLLENICKNLLQFLSFLFRKLAFLFSYCIQLRILERNSLNSTCNGMFSNKKWNTLNVFLRDQRDNFVSSFFITQFRKSQSLFLSFSCSCFVKSCNSNMSTPHLLSTSQTSAW